MLRNIRHRIGKDDGQAVVEFGLMIPILIIVILGILEFGWVLNAQITLTSAAREGARAAAVNTTDRENRAFTAVQDAVTGVSGITLIHDANHFSYLVEQDEVNHISNVVIAVDGNLRPLIGLFITNPYEIHARAVMRIE